VVVFYFASKTLRELDQSVKNRLEQFPAQQHAGHRAG